MLCILLALFAGGVLALASLTVAFRLPTRQMKERLSSSAMTFQKEGDYPRVIRNTTSTMLDNFTDALMLNNAVYSERGTSPLDAALHIYRFSNGETASANLVKLLEAGPEGMKRADYARYWHGYIVLLRPLLLFFNYEDLRALSCAVQFALMLCIFCLLFRREETKSLVVPFAGYLLAVSPIVVVLSLQFFSMHALTMLCCILLLLFAERLSDSAFEWLFFVIGMLSSFLDLLTFPLITLGIPLCLAIRLRPRETAKESLRFVACCALMWAVGYFGFWITKWIFAYAMGNRSIFADAAGAVTNRLSNTARDSSSINRFDAIGLNLSILFESPAVRIAFAAAVLGGVIRRAVLRDVERIRMREGLPMLLLGAMPFCWWFVLANHSHIHSWFTFRIGAIAVFALLTCLYGRRNPAAPDPGKNGSAPSSATACGPAKGNG